MRGDVKEFHNWFNSHNHASNARNINYSKIWKQSSTFQGLYKEYTILIVIPLFKVHNDEQT